MCVYRITSYNLMNVTLCLFSWVTICFSQWYVFLSVRSWARAVLISLANESTQPEQLQDKSCLGFSSFWIAMAVPFLTRTWSKSSASMSVEPFEAEVLAPDLALLEPALVVSLISATGTLSRPFSFCSRSSFFIVTCYIKWGTNSLTSKTKPVWWNQTASMEKFFWVKQDSSYKNNHKK